MPPTQCITRHDAGGYDRFESLANAEYDRTNAFLQRHVTFTAREWAIARLCADFRTGTGVEMTKIGENLPDLVPFMDEPYTRQAVYSARRSFEETVQTAAATFLYGAFSAFLTADELDEVLYEATETAKFLLEVEGADLSHEAEFATEQQAGTAMEEVREASRALRYDSCPCCGHELTVDA